MSKKNIHLPITTLRD